MKHSLSPRFLALLFAGLLAVGLASCSSTQKDVITTSGQDIAPATFAQVVPGQTKEFVVSVLGQPSERLREENGNELWKWYYFQKHRTGDVFFLSPVTEETKTESVHTVEFRGNVVIKTTGP
jgi:outer membrane protein assembly factor BamE (lipoprotein component of BamABCDE complex)